jgi:FtsH-binding integral membrane protein
LRVSDIPGTTVLMLALGYACGSIAEFLVSFVFFSRDFGLSRGSLLRLFFQSFAAAVIGATVTYLLLSLTGAAGTVNTTLGLVAQGMAAGLTGLLVTGMVLWLLKNPELHEAIGAFRAKFKNTPPVVLEPTDVSS